MNCYIGRRNIGKLTFEKEVNMYAVMRNPKTTSKKSHIRMSPETFETKEAAYAYIEECKRRRFLLNDYLIVVKLQFLDIEEEHAEKLADSIANIMFRR